MRNPDNRRARLKEWFETHTIPTAEKSYISQLLSGTASFGEKAAIRLEELLGMPDGYLDLTPGTQLEDENTAAVLRMMQSTDEEGRIRSKFAVADALSNYAATKSRAGQSRALEHVPVDLLEKIAKITDPTFTSSLEGLTESFLIQQQQLKHK